MKETDAENLVEIEATRIEIFALAEIEMQAGVTTETRDTKTDLLMIGTVTINDLTAATDLEIDEISEMMS